LLQLIRYIDQAFQGRNVLTFPVSSSCVPDAIFFASSLDCRLYAAKNNPVFELKVVRDKPQLGFFNLITPTCGCKQAVNKKENARDQY
jgi:hypothetical protein